MFSCHFHTSFELTRMFPIVWYGLMSGGMFSFLGIRSSRSAVLSLFGKNVACFSIIFQVIVAKKQSTISFQKILEDDKCNIFLNVKQEEIGN